MIGRSIGVLFVVGSGFALVACGGKATAGGFQGAAGNGGGVVTTPPAPTTPPGVYQTPPTTYDTPPPTYDTPPTTYDNPGGAGAQACTELCNSFVNRTCAGQVITAQAVAECPGECSDLIAEFEPCGTEYGALLSCIMHTQFFQDLIDAACAGEEIDIEEADAQELVAACQSQADAFEACSGSISQPNPEEDCSPEGGCLCPNACSSCQCSEGAGSETCMVICNPPA